VSPPSSAGLGPFAAAGPFTTGYHEEKATLFAETLPYIASSMQRDPQPRSRVSWCRRKPRLAAGVISTR
jgi:hypothetical protein